MAVPGSPLKPLSCTGSAGYPRKAARAATNRSWRMASLALFGAVWLSGCTDGCQLGGEHHPRLTGVMGRAVAYPHNGADERDAADDIPEWWYSENPHTGEAAAGAREAAARDSSWPVLLIALLGLVGVAARRQLLRAGAGVHATKCRTGLGPPLDPTTLEGRAEGTNVVLDGRLVVEGDFTGRFEDGDEAAVATAATVAGRSRVTGESITVNTRAERLLLVMDGNEKLPIVGPVEALTGSREIESAPSVDALLPEVQDRLDAASPSAQTLLSGHPVTLRSIAPNDRVRVTGVLRRIAWDDQAVTYRRAARRLVLAGGPTERSHRPVQAVFAGCPQVAPAATKRLSGVILGWLFGIGCICGSAIAGVVAGNALAVPDPLLGRVPATILGPCIGATLTVAAAMCIIAGLLLFRRGRV